MDKFTNINTSWNVPYNITTPSLLNEHQHVLHHHHHHDNINPQNPVDHHQTQQWPIYYPSISIQNSTNEPSSSSLSTSHHLLTSSQNYFLGVNAQATDDDRSSKDLDDNHQSHSQEIGNDGPKEDQEDEEELGAMKEMMFKIAAMQPVDIDPATIRKPRRRNVRISDEPQSVAARQRRERISEKIMILQRLVPGGTKMDTATMLDEAVRYVKFLKRQTRILTANHKTPPGVAAADTVAAENPAASYLFGGGNYNNDMASSGEHNNPTFFNY